MKFSEGDLNDIIRSFILINKATSWFTCMFCDPREIGTLCTVFSKTNLKNVQPLYWYKPGTTVAGDPDALINAMETAVTGVFGNHKPVYDIAPKKRHNFLPSPHLLTFQKDTNNKVLNKFEKPTAVWTRILEPHVTAGDSVVVLGAGAGGEVRACIQMGLNVVAVEQDEWQFKHLCSQLQCWDANLEKKLAAEEKAQKELDEDGLAEEAEVLFCSACEADLSGLEDGPAECKICNKRCVCKSCTNCAACKAHVQQMANRSAQLALAQA